MNDITLSIKLDGEVKNETVMINVNNVIIEEFKVRKPSLITHRI